MARSSRVASEFGKPPTSPTIRLRTAPVSCSVLRNASVVQVLEGVRGRESSDTVGTSGRLSVATKNTVGGVDSPVPAGSRDLSNLGTSGRLADLPGLASVTTSGRCIGVPVDRVRRKGLSAHVRNVDQETDGHGIDLIATPVDIGGLLFGGDGLGPDLGPPDRADAVGGLVEKGDRQDDGVSATARLDADGEATGQADPVVTGLSGRSGFVQDRSVTSDETSRGEAMVRGDQTGHVFSVRW
jgi:hypothetical protein